MAIVPSDLTTQWSTLFETLFLQEYNQNVAVSQALLDPLILEIPIPDQQGDTVQLDWLGAAPQMQEWVDEKKSDGLGNYDWKVKVARYQASIDIDLDALRDARFNPYEMRIREMAQNASRLRYNLISDLIKNGASQKCYDGQYFFDTDHQEGASGVQSNQLTGAGSSQANIETDFYTAKSALMGFKDDKGEVMGGTDFRPLVWIPNSPTLEQRFRTLQGATTIANTANVLVNSFDLVVDPRLTDGTDWYMFRTDGVMKPFVFANREAPNYEDNFDAKVGDPFERRKGKASVVARMKAAFLMWQKAVQVVNS